MQKTHYSISFLSKGREHRKSEAHQNSLQGLERMGGEWLNNKLRHNSSGKKWNGTFLQNGKHTCRGEEALQKGFGSLSSQAHQPHRAAAEKTDIPGGSAAEHVLRPKRLHQPGAATGAVASAALGTAPQRRVDKPDAVQRIGTALRRSCRKGGGGNPNSVKVCCEEGWQLIFFPSVRISRICFFAARESCIDRAAGCLQHLESPSHCRFWWMG